jgi:WD repeat and SOF domain-containing protein 1
VKFQAYEKAINLFYIQNIKLIIIQTVIQYYVIFLNFSLYTFDMRNLRVPIQVHKDHVSAVIAIDYSPTGKEFVCGSYDKTIRIFEADKGRSREVYHTKRMQRLTSVLWSLDSKYIISSSDEMDIRIWKANASEKLGVKSFREKSAFRYQEKLKEKFGNHPEIKRIARHRHVPKHIYHSQREKRLMIESRKRKYDFSIFIYCSRVCLSKIV